MITDVPPGLLLTVTTLTGPVVLKLNSYLLLGVILEFSRAIEAKHFPPRFV